MVAAAFYGHCPSRLARPWPLWEHIEKVQPKAKFIRDVANASKHVVIDRNPSTSMSHQANTLIQTAGFGEGGYGVGRYSAPSVMMSEGAGEVSLDGCARAVFDVGYVHQIATRQDVGPEPRRAGGFTIRS
jgi:hypothetical protein